MSTAIHQILVKKSTR